jgi:hypothetical protein
LLFLSKNSFAFGNISNSNKSVGDLLKPGKDKLRGQDHATSSAYSTPPAGNENSSIIYK